MADLEALIVTEARRQGHQPDQHAVMQAGMDLAGATMTSQGLINMPGRGSISPADFVRSLRNTMPAAFTPVSGDKATTADERPVGNLTAAMMAEVAASRKQARITDADLDRYTGVTRQHMEERRRAAQK